MRQRPPSQPTQSLFPRLDADRDGKAAPQVQRPTLVLLSHSAKQTLGFLGVGGNQGLWGSRRGHGGVGDEDTGFADTLDWPLSSVLMGHRASGHTQDSDLEAPSPQNELEVPSSDSPKQTLPRLGPQGHHCITLPILWWKHSKSKGPYPFSGPYKAPSPSAAEESQTQKTPRRRMTVSTPPGNKLSNL